MTRELSIGWFRLEEERHRAYIESGQRRLAALDAQRRDIRTIAREALAQRGFPIREEDRELLRRAIAGGDLEPWQARRVEYLARKATASSSQKLVGDVGTRRPSVPAAEKVQGWTGPAAAVCQASVMRARIGRRRGNGDACQKLGGDE